MSRFRALLKVQAFESGRVQPYRESRQLHLAEGPFVMAYVQMSAEPYSLWACRCGRDPEKSYWIAAHDPRDRDQQSAAFTELAAVLLDEVDTCLERDLEPLQIWVSNAGAAANLRRLGRVMRARFVSDDVSLAGAVLDMYAQSADAPGSALCVAATEALSAHGVTGQSDLEDANLAAQLVWWNRRVLCDLDPDISAAESRRLDVFQAARRAEQMPMGTLTRPERDDELQPLLADLAEARREGRSLPRVEHRVEELLDAQVLPIWHAIWAAHGELASLPESVAAEDRWADDGRLFTWQHQYLRNGGRAAYKDSPMRAARMLSTWEARHADLVRNSVLEDDLALMEAVVDGKALIGALVHREDIKIPPRRTHPYLTIEVPSTPLTPDTTVWLRSTPAVEGVVREVNVADDVTQVVVEVTAGMTKNPMPDVGTTVAFITHASSFPMRPKMPATAPWTHQQLIEETTDADDDAD